MFNRHDGLRLFSYKSKNYANGTRQETEWNLGGTAITFFLILFVLLAGVPHGKILETLNILRIFTR